MLEQRSPCLHSRIRTDPWFDERLSGVVAGYPAPVVTDNRKGVLTGIFRHSRPALPSGFRSTKQGISCVLEKVPTSIRNPLLYPSELRARVLGL
jgi:hypothetical protein